MASKKSIEELRTTLLTFGGLREKLTRKASELSAREKRLQDEVKERCKHDGRCLHFLNDPAVRICYTCGLREEAVKGVFALITAGPFHRVHPGQITDPGRSVGVAIVQKMFCSLARINRGQSVIRIESSPKQRSSS